MHKLLEKWLKTDRIPQSLLFTGPLHSAKEREALAFAKTLSEPPDLYLYYPEGKLGLHSMETLRLLRDEVYLPPYKAKRKVFILYAADRMLPASANALLKTFEEPLDTSTIILISSYPDRLLPTVRSRCQSVYFQEERMQEGKFLSLLKPLFIQLPYIHPIEILDLAGKLAEVIEKEAEVIIAEENKEETAFQKQKREKEGEGQGALKLLEITEGLWVSILRWYRDLHAVHLSLPKSVLLEPSLYAALQQKVDQGAFPNLDKAQKVVEKAKQALSRSAPLKHVLESLFFDLRSI